MRVYSTHDQIILSQLVCEAMAPQTPQYDVQFIENGQQRGATLYIVNINNIFSGAFLFYQNTVTFYNSDMKNQLSQNLAYPEATSTFKKQLDPLNGQQFRNIGLDGFKQKIESLLSGNQPAQQAPAQQAPAQQAPAQQAPAQQAPAQQAPAQQAPAQ